MADGACRICGRYDWQYQNQQRQQTSRGIHEAAHIRRGEAIWTTPPTRKGEGSRGIEITDLGRERFKNGTPAAAPNGVPNTAFHKTHSNSIAARVRDLFAQMPAEFTVRDLINKDPSIPPASAGSAIRWSRNHGILKYVRTPSVREWRSAGNVGAPPIYYSYAGLEAYTEQPQTRKVAKRQKQELTPTPHGALLPSQVSAALSVIEDEGPTHQCDATQVLENVQRSLATINMLIAMQKLTPEQAMSIAGTINTLGEQSHRRGRR